MPTRRARLVALAALAAGMLLAGCGSDDGGGSATPASETTTLDPGVTFDQDVTVPSAVPDGSTPPGTATTEPPVQTEVGEVPPQFPEAFPVPEGAEVEVGSIGRVEGELRLAVDYTVAEATPPAVHDFYRTAIDDAGFAVLLDSDDGQGADYVGQMVFETETFIGNVLVSGDGADGVLLTLTATLPD